MLCYADLKSKSYETRIYCCIKKIDVQKIWVRSAGAESLNRNVCYRKARRLFPSLSGEMPTVSPFYEHAALQQAEAYKQAGSSVARQYGTKH